jgi:hypothetical protein
MAPRAVRVSAWIAVAAGGTGCPSAKITKLEATPRHVCPGDPVELAWAFDGSGTMTVTPPIAQAPSGRVDDHGTAVIHPTANTTIGLQVTRWGGEPAGGRLDIEISRGETLTASIADPSAACRDGVVTSTAHITNFAPDLTVLELDVPRSDTRAGYDVTRIDERTHRPVTAHVAPGSASSRFAGLPIAGDWILSSPLAPGESCDPPRLPGNLIVVAYMQCAGGGGGKP